MGGCVWRKTQHAENGFRAPTANRRRGWLYPPADRPSRSSWPASAAARRHATIMADRDKPDAWNSPAEAGVEAKAPPHQVRGI
jgi:hypothetical protein